MTQMVGAEPELPASRDWLQTVAKYREPDPLRSVAELALTAIMFFVLWAAAWWSLSISYLLTLAVCVPTGGLLLRLFSIQHDCGHGALFVKKATNDWVGRVIGVFTLTPYDVWRRSHAMHHGTSGDLGKRGMGDIATLTVQEYLALPRWRRFAYRLYRHPVVLFGVGPTYNFLLRNRLPIQFMRAGWRYWVSTMATNAALALTLGLAVYAVGIWPFLLIHIPVVLIATSIGVWLFYVQHQFENTYWEKGDDWSLEDAALKGSSYYELPRVLSWFSANINLHHVHHLNSRIPFYRLPQVLRDYPELLDVSRLTLMQSLHCARLALWDETAGKLISFAKLRAAQPEAMLSN